MKREFRNLMLSFLLVGCAMFLFVETTSAQAWNVPAKYKSMKNTKKGDADAAGVGKSLFNQHCASCHGKTGAGDGKKADMLDTEMNELKEALKNDSDGVVYYKSFIGRDEMPNFMKKIPSESDRWLLVNYLRKL